MNRSITFALGAALLMAAPGVALAGGTGLTNSNSASKFAPGQIQRDTGVPAKTNAPGQRMQNAAPNTLTGPGASQFAPGQMKKDPPKAR